MAKYCPFMKAVCNSECGLRIDEDCAITSIAKSFKIREIRKEIVSKVINMRYGTCSLDKYVDTDSFSESSLEDLYRREGYKNENT